MSKDGARPRYGGSKTRTGCITCKLRHVKCDETKPRCSRCVKAGRVCEGYHAPAKARSSDQLRIVHYVAPNSRSVSPFPESDAREIRALEYFKLVTAVQLAGPFSPDLWARDMLRIAYHQPSVHHALIALGTVHEEFARPSSTPDFSDYASREYGKAVQKIINLTDSASSHGIETTLATCVLFSCLESLRGHYQSSLSHIMSGLSILEEDERQQRHVKLSCIPRELLVSLFRRLDSQRMELGGAGGIQGSMLSMTYRPSIPETFLSINDAWFAFDMINYDFLQLQYFAEAVAEDQSKLSIHWSSLVAQQAALEVQRQTWENAYHRMLDRDGLTGRRERTRAMILLDMANTTWHIMLNVDLLEPESDFDKHLGLFSRIIDDAEELHHRHCERSSLQTREDSANRTPSDASPTPPRLLPEPEPEPTPIFTLSLGFVNILYLTASRCRNTAIRYRALNLLRKCNRREGLWDSNIAAKVAESVIAIEEAKTLDSLRNLSLGSNKMKLPQLDEVVIPYENRVKTIDLRFGPEARGKVMYSLEYVTRNSDRAAMPSAMDTSGMGELLEW